MFKNDYIMKKINNMVRIIASILLGKSFEEYRIPDLDKYTKTDDLYKEILKLLDNGNINGAEDMLFNNFTFKDEQYIEIILDFYNRLNQLSDKELNDKNFSRKEIKEGLEDIFENYDLNLLDL